MKGRHFLIGLILMLITAYGASAATIYIDELDVVTDSEPEPEPQPGPNEGQNQISFTDIRTEKSANTMTVTLDINNACDGETLNGIVELQARKKAVFAPLSFFKRESAPCDPDTPWNTHGSFYVEPCDSQEISLVSNVERLGFGIMDFYLVSVDQCCSASGGCNDVEPFGWETLIATDVQYGPDGGEPLPVACTYDFECAESLGLPAGSSFCDNSGTEDSFCSALTKIESGASFLGPGLLWFLKVIVALTATIIFIIMIVATTRWARRKK